LVNDATLTVQSLNNLDEEIGNCIEKGVGLFGSTVSSMIFWHCSFNSKLEKKEIPQNPDLFEENLRILFGDSAASIIRTITKEIRMAYHLSPEGCDSLNGAIQAARRSQTQLMQQNPLVKD